MLEFYEFWLDLAAIVIGIFLQRKGKKNQNKSMLVVGKTLIVLGAILVLQIPPKKNGTTGNS